MKFEDLKTNHKLMGDITVVLSTFNTVYSLIIYKENTIYNKKTV